MIESSDPTIMWFRDDLRLADNPALMQAVDFRAPVIPVYVHDVATPALRRMGAASGWWLHKSLEALSRSIEERGNQLHLRSGDSSSIIEHLAEETGAKRIVWNRRYGKAERDIDAGLKERLRQKGMVVESFNGNLLNEPWTIRSKSQKPFKVFTPFWKTCLAGMTVDRPSPAPQHLPMADLKTPSEQLDRWNLKPSAPNWAAAFNDIWDPGEAGAIKRLDGFLSERLQDYAQNRDCPGTEGTSRLSPHLAFGEISPRQIWWAVHGAQSSDFGNDADKFLSEIGWREFAYHILFSFPGLATENFQNRFDAFEWSAPDENLVAWQRGQTGYPIVDASMRQLWQTGWMHNRCRMIVGSFLTKHLLIDWRHGEEWFWDTLVDADQANNPAGWQWIAGTGADAAPYFRVFNPILQSRKFDPDGAYIRRFCPELANLDNDRIHEPWTASEAELEAAGVRLGHNYPHPIIDHKAARQRALATYSALALAQQNNPGKTVQLSSNMH